jgi:hypothetical protein
MKLYTLEAAPTAGAVEVKNNNKSTKAKRILVGVDAHLRGYQAARKVDNGVIGAVETCRSEVELSTSKSNVTAPSKWWWCTKPGR